MPPSPPLNNPAILVAYATSTGTTREIAERIASTLQTTTAWRVDCKPVGEIRSLHKELHLRRPAPNKPVLAEEVPPAPAATPVTPNGTGTPPVGVEDHTIHANPLSAFISNEPAPEPETVEYRAIVIGSSIHTGKWLSSGRGFIRQNRDFFTGRCCAPAVNAKKPSAKGKGSGGWATLWGISEQHARQPQPELVVVEPAPVPEEEEVVMVAPPKIYAFSVGMPGNDDALTSEEKSVEAALRKELGKLPSPGANAHGVEEEEVLRRHVLFRGMWSPRQIEILAPRVVSRVLNWCIPKDSKFMKEDDERDWKSIEAWAAGVGREVVGGGGRGEEEEPATTAVAA